MKRTLKELSQGQQFTHGGIQWVVLDHTDAGTLSLAADIIEEKEFDEENLNDWRKSTLREYLNRDFFVNGLLAAGAAADDFLKMTVDLTADDRMTDYGTDTCKVALLSADQYRKYRRFIPNASGWWLITPYSCGEWYSNGVRIVRSNGSLSHFNASSGSFGVRPVCRLSSDIMVTVEGGEDNVAEELADVKKAARILQEKVERLERRLHDRTGGRE